GRESQTDLLSLFAVNSHMQRDTEKNVVLQWFNRFEVPCTALFNALLALILMSQCRSNVRQTNATE
ncbi:MAG: hypothetical protein ACXWFY_01505, partial [Chthoniobacterales bacterium]